MLFSLEVASGMRHDEKGYPAGMESEMAMAWQVKK
jgi:hypothetical protein